MKNPRTELFRRLLKALAEDEWHFGQYTATHLKSELEIWTSNGWSFVNTYPSESNFTLLQRWRLSRALRDAKVRDNLARWNGAQTNSA